jgi:hypothetical protein
LTKFFTYLFLLVSCSVLAQHQTAPAQKEAPWEQNQRAYRYVKARKYTGPHGTQSMQPASMQDVSEDDAYYENYSEGLSYSPKDIRRARAEKRGEANEGNGAGGKARNPDISQPEPINVPEPAPAVNPPVPDADLPVPLVSSKIWMGIGLLLLVVVLALIIYQVARKHHPANRRVATDFSPDAWNPLLIPKTDLELRLEEAMLREDYRACVRIYFTFILKELIRLNHIQWKKELTNYDYWLQVQGRPGAADFAESIRIYDLIWYGEYDITRTEFEQVLPHLEHHYQQLTAAHE